MSTNALFFPEHAEHKWVEVSPCVYCEDCNVRLYTGSLPTDRAPANRAMCRHENQDHETGMGFSVLCRDCGATGWWDWDEGHTREWIAWPDAESR